MTYSPIIGMKTRMLPVTSPGQSDRQGDLAEGRPAAGAEVLGGLGQRPVHPLQRHVEREDHQRQVPVDEADHHRRRRPEDLDLVGAGQRLEDARQPASGPRIRSQA